MANIACPAQILEQRSFISADYWGRTKAILREKLGEDVYLLGLCGAAGDQCPRDLVRWVDPETPIDDPNVKRPNVIKRKADPSMYDIAGCNKVGSVLQMKSFPYMRKSKICRTMQYLYIR